MDSVGVLWSDLINSGLVIQMLPNIDWLHLMSLDSNRALPAKRNHKYKNLSCDSTKTTNSGRKLSHSKKLIEKIGFRGFKIQI